LKAWAIREVQVATAAVYVTKAHENQGMRQDKEAEETSGSTVV